MEKLANIQRTVMKFFSKSIDIHGKALGFTKRKSKLTAKNFCKIVLGSCLSDNNPSLEAMCSLAKENGLRITKQGLQKRFSSSATLLMQTLFMKALEMFKTKNQMVLGLLANFTTVGMVDSSGIALHHSLKDIYKGWAEPLLQLGLNYKPILIIHIRN